MGIYMPLAKHITIKFDVEGTALSETMFRVTALSINPVITFTWCLDSVKYRLGVARGEQLREHRHRLQEAGLLRKENWRRKS